MRTETEWLCDIPRFLGKTPPGCARTANLTLYCKVEGREIHMCMPCKTAWNRRVGEDPRLAAFCPNCSEKVSQHTVVPIPQVPVHPVTDIFHQAIDHAMHMEGILEPVRQKVMARLAHEAPWMCEQPGEVALCR